jgi:hypothetical protein
VTESLAVALLALPACALFVWQARAAG